MKTFYTYESGPTGYQYSDDAAGGGGGYLNYSFSGLHYYGQNSNYVTYPEIEIFSFFSEGMFSITLYITMNYYIYIYYISVGFTYIYIIFILTKEVYYKKYILINIKYYIIIYIVGNIVIYNTI